MTGARRFGRGATTRPRVFRSRDPYYRWGVVWFEPVGDSGWAFCEEGFMTWEGAFKCALALASNLLYSEGR